MPTLLLSFKRNSDSSILIHGTLTPNGKQSAKEMEQHAGVCPRFGPVYRANQTINIEIDVESIPEFDEEEIDAWLETEFGIGEEEEEDEEDGEEEEEEEAKPADG